MFPSHLCRFPLHSLCLSLPQCSNNKRQVSTVTSETRKYVINSNHHWILFRLLRRFCAFLRGIFASSHCWIFTYHPQSVSLPPQWKTYSQISPWIVFKSFTFYPVSQIVPVEVLRQVTSIMELFSWKQLKVISR